MVFFVLTRNKKTFYFENYFALIRRVCFCWQILLDLAYILCVYIYKDAKLDYVWNECTNWADETCLQWNICVLLEEAAACDSHELTWSIF